MILVVGEFRMPQENLEQARPLMRKVIAATLEEDGCIDYAYAEDVAEPGLIRVSEKWRERACLEAHLKSPHMAEWVRERAGLGLFGRDIAIWDVGEGEAV